MPFEQSGFSRDVDEILKPSPSKATPLDLFMCYRLLLGRLPEWGDYAEFSKHVSTMEVSGLVNGFLRSEEYLKRWGAEKLVIPEVPVMAELDGLRLWFYLSDRIVGWGAVQGQYESDLVEAILATVRPGMVCCDVGANLGYFSLLMARVGADVYAFEPFPKNLALLGRNAAENALPGKIHVLPFAASDANRSTTLCVDKEESHYVGAFVAHAAGSAGGFREISIQSARIDDVIPTSVRIDCVKMDIEGSEPLALRGMERILRADRPTVFLEFNPFAIEKHAGQPPEDLASYITSLGYTITHLDGSKWVYSYELANLVARPVL